MANSRTNTAAVARFSGMGASTVNMKKSAKAKELKRSV